MDKKLCKKCFMEKSVSNYYKSQTSKDKLMSHCKICHHQKTKKIKPSKTTDNSSPNMYRLYRTTKEDYALMYDMLKLIGYDISNGDIHQQFINKANDKFEFNLKYKKRGTNNMNAYLPDGSLNTDNKKNMRNIEAQNNKKNPTD